MVALGNYESQTLTLNAKLVDCWKGGGMGIGMLRWIYQSRGYLPRRRGRMRINIPLFSHTQPRIIHISLFFGLGLPATFLLRTIFKAHSSCSVLGVFPTFCPGVGVGGGERGIRYRWLKYVRESNLIIAVGVSLLVPCSVLGRKERGSKNTK